MIASLQSAHQQLPVFGLIAKAMKALHEAQERFPRKHRIDPTSESHQPDWIDPQTYALLVLAEEAIFATVQLNQKANRNHPEVSPPVDQLAPILQAAEQSLERETQRRLDSERSYLIRHGLAESQ